MNLIKSFLAAALLALLACAGDSSITANGHPPRTPAGQLVISPNAMNFGDVAIGQSAAQHGTMKASGGDVTVSSASWNGQGYSVADITFPITVPSNQSVPYTVTFAPQTTGNTSASLTFHSNAGNSLRSEELIGAGVQAIASGVQLLPSSSSLPLYGIQSITAQIAGIVDQRVTWSAPGATILGSGNTVGVKSNRAQTITVTATSVADGTKKAVATVTFTTAPTPVTSHPRIWLTSSDVTRLRSWAATSNPGWQHGTNGGLYYVLSSAKDTLDAHWSWSFQSGTGLPDSYWKTSDRGDSGFGSVNVTEEYMAVMAFGSLITPNASDRTAYGNRAHDLLMWVMNMYANDGFAFLPNQPFRDPTFPVDDRMRVHGWAWGTTVDWLQAGGYLSTTELAVIREVFLAWGQKQVTTGVTTSTYPMPIGSYNSSSVLTTAPLRWAINNHSLGQFRALALQSLSLDAANDVCASGGIVVSDGSADCVRAYIKDVTGAWMYRIWAEFEDANVVASQYGVSPSGLGKTAGGTGVEGVNYDYSLSILFSTYWAFHTAGMDDPSTFNSSLGTSGNGPQVCLLTSSFWDLRLQSMLTSLAPYPETYNITYGPGYPIYLFVGAFEDRYRNYTEQFTHATPFNMMGAYDVGTGNTTRNIISRWIALNTPFGGASNQDKRTGSYIWGNNDGLMAISYFMAYDPSASAPPDPRSKYNLDYYVAPYGYYFGRTDWTNNQNAVDFLCGWETIDHQVGNCGLFSYWRKGEFLTTELGSYSYHYEQYQPQYHNALSIQQSPGATYNGICNSLAGTCSNVYDAVYTSGGQWPLGLAAGDPTITASYGPDYSYITADMTNLYNSPNQYVPANNLVDVQYASRSLFWLKRSDLVVIYDRAKTGGTNQFKRFNLQLTGTPSTTGDVTTVAEPDGQRLFITALLPNSGTVSISTGTSDAITQIAEPALINHKYQVMDTANPSSIRFLHVLEGADSGADPTPASLLNSSSGTAFDVAVIGTTAILFKRNLSDSFASMSFSVPSNVTTQYVTDLTPYAGYMVKITAIGSSKQVTVGVGGATMADAAGVIAF